MQHDGIFLAHLKSANAGVATTGGRGGEELVRSSPDGFLNYGGLATSGHADAAQLQEVVSSDTSAGDKNKEG